METDSRPVIVRDKLGFPVRCGDEAWLYQKTEEPNDKQILKCVLTYSRTSWAYVLRVDDPVDKGLELLLVDELRTPVELDNGEKGWKEIELKKYNPDS